MVTTKQRYRWEQLTQSLDMRRLSPMPFNGETRIYMANRPVIIGLTGGIGSGKTTCANLARESGFAVYDCDEAIMGAYADAGFMRRFRHAFRLPSSVTDAGARELAKDDAGYRRRVSPLLKHFIEESLKEFLACRISERGIIVDAPLLFEWELDRLCDFTICLVAPESERLKRVLARKDPAMTEADFMDVIKHQVSDEFRVSRASKIVDGAGSIDGLRVAFLSALELYVPVRGTQSPKGEPGKS